MNNLEKFLYQKKFSLLAILLIFIGFFISNISNSIWIDILKIIIFILTVMLIIFAENSSEPIPEPMSEEEHQKMLEEALKERKKDPLVEKLRQTKKKEIHIPGKELPENTREQAEKDFNSLVKRVFELTKSALVADTIAFYVKDPSSNSFMLKESLSNPELSLKESFPVGNSLLDSVVNNNRVVLENEIPPQSRVASFHKDEQQKIHSFIGAPVHYREKPIGVIFVDALAKSHFNESDKVFIENLANIVSNGISATDRLYETAQLANTYRIFVSLNQQLAATESKTEIFDIISDYLAKYFRADRLIISTVIDNNRIKIEKIVGPKDVVRADQEITVEDGLVGLVLRQNKTLLIKNVDTDKEKYTPRFFKNEPHGQAMSSFLSVPVLQNEKPIAVIVLEAFAPSAFTESDKEALNALATNASLALSSNQMFLQLEELSVRDELTDLWNAKGLSHRLEEEMSRSVRFENKLSVFLLDIDNFTQLKENYGESSAIILLKEFSRYVKEKMRIVDILARIDEDRFVALLPSTSRFGARILAERVRQNISEKPFYIEGDIIKLHISGSIVEYPEMGETADIVFDKLVKALNSVKRNGGNKITIYSKKMEDE
jgi:diguanylate cyclase (GGDEF)-like protein